MGRSRGDGPGPGDLLPDGRDHPVTTTGICGSDLHLYEVMGPFMGDGDILGHEPMSIVEEVGREVTGVRPGDRVVIPFQIACGDYCSARRCSTWRTTTTSWAT